MRRPRIGINSELEAGQRKLGDTKLITLNPDYARCVARAGGVPLVLSPLTLPGDPRAADESTIEEQLAVIDGLVLVGGDDMDPRAYGEAPHPSIQPLDPERDAYDFALARAALERGIPILGICGGMQLLNVVRGGSLHQHLPDREGDTYPTLHPVHRDQHGEAKFHDVLLRAGTRLAETIGAARIVTNSRHHQAVARLGDDVTIAAVAEDGVIEAIEVFGSDDSRYIVGVEWHPEEARDDSASIRIFGSFVEHAARHAKIR